jgi:hypothetical protein
MNTISESAPQWRPNTELAVTPSVTSVEDIPKVGDPDADDRFKIFGDDGFTFLDFLDIINPLQHIPIVGTLYREITDDSLDPGSRVIGGTLFLGPVGTVSALANVLIDDATGMDMGEHVMAYFEDAVSDQPQVSGTSPEPHAIAWGSTSTTVSSYSASPKDAGQAIDPITAWAMAEYSYPHSVAGEFPVSENTPEGLPNEQRASLSVSQTATVAEWARAEGSYCKAAAKAQPTRMQGAKLKTAKAPGWKNTSPYAAISSPALATASAGAPTRKIDALAALRKDLLAGGKPAMSRAASLTRGARQRTAAGAIASEGGWFTDTMSSALGKFDDSDTLARQAVAAPTR